jgi:steroid delta-isomerase-like uncharacterized protein
VSLEEIKQIAWRFIDEILNNENTKEINSLVTPDFTYHARGEDIKGAEEFKNWIESDRGFSSDVRFTLIDSIAEHGKVATVWIVEGTHDKEFRGIPASRKKFETVGISIFHFDDGKIEEVWVIVDGLTPALELGVVKPVSNVT